MRALTGASDRGCTGGVHGSRLFGTEEHGSPTSDLVGPAGATRLPGPACPGGPDAITVGRGDRSDRCGVIGLGRVGAV